ncbi:hypothetical protein D0Y65_013409 [Glycine soja]|uniref:DUF241 domain protein n=1 Tax=Glycine soja TaxID=3848 RepID=A0A445K364_GLYSO|nr:hypothetical protein D0Y65_013409 [Glycine soja]
MDVRSKSRWLLVFKSVPLLPSTPHPLISQNEEHLHRLRDSKATSSISSSSLSHKLNAFLDLHDCADNDKCVDGILEGSLRFLDICSTAKECRQISKESLHELHSVIKRRKANETVFTTEGGKYLASRNKLKKAIRKALRNLKTIKKSQTNEFDKVDAALHSFLSHKPSPIEYLLNQIENLEMCIQDLEIGVEHLTRKLIRNIVSLLNIFNR